MFAAANSSMDSSLEQLKRLAELIKQRSVIDRDIAAIMNRPAHSGHFGAYVASTIFGIDLSPDATTKAIDGHFRDGPLAGRTVNVKYRTRHRGLLNLGASTNLSDHPDLYLILTGAPIPMGPTQGTAAPLQIDAVYLFESQPLLAEIAARGRRPGVGRSLPQFLWTAAMVFPEARNSLLRLSQEQRDALTLFAGEAP